MIGGWGLGLCVGLGFGGIAKNEGRDDRIAISAGQGLHGCKPLEARFRELRIV